MLKTSEDLAASSQSPQIKARFLSSPLREYKCVRQVALYLCLRRQSLLHPMTSGFVRGEIGRGQRVGVEGWCEAT